MTLHQYDNWKLAFLPSLILVGAYTLLKHSGATVSVASVIFGAVYAALLTDGAYFVAGRRGLKDSAGSVASILVHNICGAILFGGTLFQLMPEYAVRESWWIGHLGLLLPASLLCGAMECLAHRCDSISLAAIIGAFIYVSGLPHITLAFPGLLCSRQYGKAAIAYLFIITGNLLGARLWTSVHAKPKG